MGVTNAGAKMTENEHEMTTGKGASTALSSTQLDGARLLALHPTMTRKAVAKGLGVSVRSVFRWLQDEEFRSRVNELRRSALVELDAESVLKMLSAREREKLRSMLHQTGSGAVDISEEIRGIEEKLSAHLDRDYMANKRSVEQAAVQIALLLGRIWRSTGSVHYRTNGAPVADTRAKRFGWLFEHYEIISRIVDDESLHGALVEARRMFDSELLRAGYEDKPGPSLGDFDVDALVTESVYTAVDYIAHDERLADEDESSWDNGMDETGADGWDDADAEDVGDREGEGGE